MNKFLCALLGIILGFSQLYAQNRTISGRVTDATGNPLVGATVSVVGATTSVTTNTTGAFSIAVPAAARELEISYVGHTTQRIGLRGRTDFSVTLAAASENLAEVVVTGYGTPQRRKNTTASVATVGSKQLENRPFTSVDQMLAGKVPGLVAPASTGQPGASQSIRIRGIGSISAGSNPLYVVDGVIVNSGDVSRLTPTANTLAGINPNDIEDVTVLKDASATALYGSRGANGVILITTKSGRAGKTKFRADVEMGLTNNAPLPEAGRSLNADEWLMLFEEGMRNAGLSQATIDANLLANGKGNGVNTDWLDIVTRQGQQQQYNLSASGGEGKTTFYISGGYFNQEASVLASSFKRYSLATNFKHTVNNRFTLGVNLSGNNSKQLSPSAGGAYANPTGGVAFLRPTQTPYNPDGSLNINRTGNNFSSNFNPLYIAENDIRDLNTVQLRGNINGEYAILPNLKLSSRFGMDYNNIDEYQFWNPFHGDGRTTGGRGQASDTRISNWISTSQLNYSFSPDRNRNFKVDALLAYEAQKSKTEALDASATSFPPTNSLPLSTNAATVINGKLSAADYSFNSIISTGSVNYKNRYIVNGSFRRDGSSRFSENNRYGDFWSVGGAWNIDQENFFAPNRYISSAKLRVTYGTTGNAGIGNYGWRQTFGYGANYNGNPGGTFNSVGNADLTWETNTQFDVGTDISFLKNRVSITADYYKRVSSNLLFAEPLSPTSGFSSITRNIGTMQNTGIEFAINATPVSTKNFKWDLNFNIAHNKNKITKLPGGKDIIDGTFILREGYDYRTFYARTYVGVNPDNGDPLWYKDSSHKETVNNRGLAIREVLAGKSASPKYTGGFNNTLTYKGFSLGTEFVYNFGNYVTDGWAFYLVDGVDPLQGKYALNLRRWQKPGDITDVPKYVYGSTNNSSSFSTRFMQKGDFIRLRNVTLGYLLDSKITNRFGMSSLNFYVRGTNLWTKTYDKNLTIDPEAGVNGSSDLNIYYSRTITAGLNIGF
ncbi:MAG TPA: TonB-dependent receptor [Segetibacter sp.]